MSLCFLSLRSLLKKLCAQCLESTGNGLFTPFTRLFLPDFITTGSITVARRLQRLLFRRACSWCRIEVRHVFFFPATQCGLWAAPRISPIFFLQWETMYTNEYRCNTLALAFLRLLNDAIHIIDFRKSAPRTPYGLRR